MEQGAAGPARHGDDDAGSLADVAAAREAGRLDEAEAILESLLRRAPFDPAPLAALGELRLAQSRVWEAEELFRRALALDRRHPGALFGLASAALAGPDPDRAEPWLRQMLAVDPEHHDALMNLGSLLRQHLRYDEAARLFGRAARQLPPDTERGVFAHTMHALTLMGMGAWAEGWPEYEARLHTTLLAQNRTFARYAPRWAGERPADPETRLLVWHEQGLGDSIQFARYLKYPLCLGFRLIVHVQPPLERLLRISLGDYAQVVSGDSLPSGQWQCPMMSLPLALAPHLGAEIPAEVPYLSADPAQVAAFARHLDSVAPGRRRLGLAWRGNPANPNDRARSIDPRLVGLLLDIDADFFLIQPGEDPAALAAEGRRPVHDLTPMIGDFADTAAALLALDGLVSVDTSVAHLAGALGRPVWLPLPRVPDWRWGLGSPRTVWYPSVRLFRQSVAGAWGEPLSALALDLARWLAAPPEPTKARR